MLWNPLIQTGGASFGVQNNQFGFNITAARPIISHRGRSLHQSGQPRLDSARTVTLTNGSFYFSDPQWTNYSARFYGLGFP